MNRQSNLETESISVATVRQANTPDTVSPLLILFGAKMTKVFQDRLLEYFKASRGNRAAIKDEIEVLLDGVSITAMAAIVARCALISAMSEGTVTSCSFQIFNDLWMQKCFIDSSATSDRRRTLATMLRTKSAQSRQKVLKSMSGNQATAKATKCAVGSALLGLFIQSQDLVKTRMDYTVNHRTMYRLEFTEKAESLRNRLDERCLPLYLRHYPMVEPPSDWDELGQHGGYKYALGSEFPLVKGRPSNPLRHGDFVMTKASSAVNKLQSVPFEVHTEVLTVLQEVYRVYGGSVCGLPPRDPATMPHKDIPYDELSNTQKAERNFHRETEATLRGQRLSLELRMMFAERFKGETLYFPYQLDTRGRAYPIAATLSPQGDDVSKGLLRFHSSLAEPMGVSGTRWFWIHGANCMGYDKLSFDDRIERAKEAVEQHLHVADDPMGYIELWRDIDSPFQYLSWCFELRDIVDNDYFDNMEDWVSRQYIAVDGTCNGFQHFAALLRDTTTAKAVNMVPRDAPSDIYKEVATVLQKDIAEDTVSPEKDVRYYASLWAKHVNRSLVKRGVMTTPYGVTLRGILNQLLVYLRGVPLITYDSVRLSAPQGCTYIGAVQYLASKLLEAIQSVSLSSIEAMTFLREIARVYGDQWIHWQLPSGFTASQHYPAQTKKRVQTWIGNLQIQVDSDSEFYRRKQVQAISPNFVHSLDAEHMRNTINAMGDNVPLWMIHDSYGTTPAHIDQLSKTLRSEFAKMYRDNDFLSDMAAQWPTELPVPDKGDYDIDNVINSAYFFA